MYCVPSSHLKGIPESTARSFAGQCNGHRFMYLAHAGIIVDVDIVTEGGAAGSVDLDKDNLQKVARKEDLAAMKGVIVWMALVLLKLSLAIQCIPTPTGANHHDLCVQSLLSCCIKQAYLDTFQMSDDPAIKVQNQVETMGHCQMNMLYQHVHSNYHVCSALYNCHNMT